MLFRQFHPQSKELLKPWNASIHRFLHGINHICVKKPWLTWNLHEICFDSVRMRDARARNSMLESENWCLHEVQHMHRLNSRMWEYLTSYAYPISIPCTFHVAKVRLHEICMIFAWCELLKISRNHVFFHSLKRSLFYFWSHLLTLQC